MCRITSGAGSCNLLGAHLDNHCLDRLRSGSAPPGVFLLCRAGVEPCAGFLLPGFIPCLAELAEGPCAERAAFLEGPPTADGLGPCLGPVLS